MLMVRIPAYESGEGIVTGRGIPDSLKGVEKVVSGTSASTPVVASSVSLLSDHLLSQGKNPLGFLNPWLYSGGIVNLINDITSGTNPGCNTKGIPAIVGWDPVTGLGTPDFEPAVQYSIIQNQNQNIQTQTNWSES
ncbi:peptidase S8/S53 domain-containing protein [Lactarius psammicola]|nr:peptidase S8/S53 domain-containing protein [Lactarius psammicola]